MIEAVNMRLWLAVKSIPKILIDRRLRKCNQPFFRRFLHIHRFAFRAFQPPEREMSYMVRRVIPKIRPILDLENRPISRMITLRSRFVNFLRCLPFATISRMLARAVPENKCFGFTQGGLSQEWQTSSSSGIGISL